MRLILLCLLCLCCVGCLSIEIETGAPQTDVELQSSPEPIWLDEVPYPPDHPVCCRVKGSSGRVT
jgi:hypothetical protein